MLRIIDIATAPRIPMENGRGEVVRLVNSETGTDKIDVHINRLVPGGPRGKLHKHGQSDNVYIVLAGTGTLVADGQTRPVVKDQVIHIPAGMEHSLSNLGDSLFEIVEIYAPSGEAFDFILVGDEPQS
jgi:mannose-6-phosphate isomerase-like protein (cupin superfamily)